MKKKNRYNENKANAERTHFKKRALQRYGINICSSTYTKIIKAIKRISNEIDVKYLMKQSNTRVVYKITISGKDIIVIYDKSRHELVTALPYEALDRINEFLAEEDNNALPVGIIIQEEPMDIVEE
jgi:hypothetical protein